MDAVQNKDWHKPPHLFGMNCLSGGGFIGSESSYWHAYVKHFYSDRAVRARVNSATVTEACGWIGHLMCWTVTWSEVCSPNKKASAAPTVKRWCPEVGGRRPQLVSWKQLPCGAEGLLGGSPASSRSFWGTRNHIHPTAPRRTSWLLPRLLPLLIMYALNCMHTSACGQGFLVLLCVCLCAAYLLFNLL